MCTAVAAAGAGALKEDGFLGGESKKLIFVDAPNGTSLNTGEGNSHALKCGTGHGLCSNPQPLACSKRHPRRFDCVFRTMPLWLTVVLLILTRPGVCLHSRCTGTCIVVSGDGYPKPQTLNPAPTCLSYVCKMPLKGSNRSASSPCCVRTSAFAARGSSVFTFSAKRSRARSDVEDR